MASAARFEVRLLCSAADEENQTRPSSLENKLYPENQERTACVDYSKVYHPPEELQIPDGVSGKIVKVDPTTQSMTESTISCNSEKKLQIGFAK